MTSFPVVVDIPVAWGDMDVFGHVNNVQYMRYFETARVKYFEELMIGEGSKNPIQPVLANVIGQLYNSAGDLVVEATAIMVLFDFTKQQPAPVPASIRSYVEELEKTTF